jgi:hypothetical protein
MTTATVAGAPAPLFKSRSATTAVHSPEQNKDHGTLYRPPLSRLRRFSDPFTIESSHRLVGHADYRHEDERREDSTRAPGLRSRMTMAKYIQAGHRRITAAEY